MKKKVISLMLCIALLFGVLPAGMVALSASAEEADAAATGEDYTDPAHPFVASTFNELRTFINKDRFVIFDPENHKVQMSSKTYYVKLGANVSYSGYDNAEMATNGADIQLDLAGYTISCVDQSNYGFTLLVGNYGTLTINDSKRYDSSSGKWVGGKIDYIYTVPYDDRNTRTLAGKIVLNGGTVVNRTVSKAVHSAYANLKYNKTSFYTSGGSLVMNGGALEAQRPIFLGGGTGVELNGGELRVKKDVAIMMVLGKNGTDVTLPTISECDIVNSTGNSEAIVFSIEYPAGYTSAQMTSGFYGMFPGDTYAYKDGKVQSDIANGVSYGSNSFLGPRFKSSYKYRSAALIDDVRVTISEPSAGVKLSYDAYVPNGVKYMIENYTEGTWKYGVRWEKDGSGLQPGAAAELGSTYTVYISVVPSEQYGYLFASDARLSLNGRGYSDHYELSNIILTKSFTVTESITSVEVDDIDDPRPGSQADFSADILYFGVRYSVYDHTEGVWYGGVSWNKGSGQYMEPGDTFTAGETYTVTVRLKSKDKEKYPFGPSAELTAAVNGREAQIVRISDLFVDVSYTYTCSAQTAITSVSITMSEPQPGAYFNYDPSVPAGAKYKIKDLNTPDWKNGLAWCDTEGRALQPGSKFVEGEQYKAIIAVTPADTYQYAFANAISATVNGRKANVFLDGEGRWIEYTFTVQKTEVGKVELTVPEPQAGESVKYTAYINGNKVYQVKDLNDGIMYESGVAWFDNYGELNPQADNTYESGKQYTVNVRLEIGEQYKDKYRFSDGEITATVNGQAAQVFRHADGTIDVAFTFTVTGGEEIGALSLTIPEPKAGAKITYQASAPAGKGYMIEDYDDPGYWLDGVKWYCDDVLLAPETGHTFEAGKTYTAEFSVVLTDKALYQFAGIDQIQAVVNGYAAECEVFDQWNYGVMYTFTLPAGGYWIGDVNKDGAVKNRDALILDRYIAGWKDYDKQIKNWDAADLNRDGQVKNRDALMLDRYIAGWKDYQKYVIEV